MTTQDDYKRGLDALDKLFSDKNPHFNVAHHLQARWLTEHKETIRQALQSKIGADGWMDIETAPRDGTNILLSDPYSGVGDGYYTDMRWWFYQCGDDWYSEECNPTHWMPLPPAPRKEGE